MGNFLGSAYRINNLSIIIRLNYGIYKHLHDYIRSYNYSIYVTEILEMVPDHDQARSQGGSLGAKEPPL